MSSQPNPSFTNIGGQALIEGVMMRSPGFVVAAVRRPDGSIVVRSKAVKAWVARYPILKKPVLRGIVTLAESMIEGLETLSYSAQVASADEEGEALSTGALVFSVLAAIALGLGLFVALPHFLTLLLMMGGTQVSLESPTFHVIDGFLKIAILLAYVYGISLMPDVFRVFQYHGAEHKSIYAFERGEDLTVANAARHPTPHPRCGTSFLFFLVLISVLVFGAVFPFIWPLFWPLVGVDFTRLSPVVAHLAALVLKVALMFPVAGIAYEGIKFCAFRMDNLFYAAVIWPGMALQRLTTREPDASQLEVALVALRQALRLEKGAARLANGEIHEQTIRGIDELGGVRASVQEFAEA